MYPPVALSTATLTTSGADGVINSWTTTVSGAFYGNGAYKVTASSVYFENSALTHPIWWLFRRYNSDPYGAHWRVNDYSSSTGLFSSSLNSARYTLDGIYYGDWVHIQLPARIIVTKCSFTVKSDAPGRGPVLFRLYGSNDGTKWELLYEQTLALSYTSFQATFKVPGGLSYSYVGLVVSKIGLSADAVILNFRRWDIFGITGVTM
jgi:hypothetical protein